MKKINSVLIAVVIIVMIILIFTGGFLFYQQSLAKKLNSQTKIQDSPQNKNQQQLITQQVSGVQSTKQTTISANISWNTFKDKYGFQMQYSPDASIMNVPISRIVPCDSSCPTEVVVNNIESAYTNQTINGVKYCIYSGAEPTAGRLYNDYLFLTINNGVCYSLDVSYSYVNCNSYSDDATVQSCKYNEGSNQNIISQALSTIKFAK